MSFRILPFYIAAACIIAAIAPATADAGPASDQSWVSNGSSACAKYLTPDVLAAILKTPDGKAEKLDATSCRTGFVYISLAVKSVDVFRMELGQIVGVNKMTGVGDLAYWNHAGAVSAVKGRDRGCEISVLNGPYMAKIHDEELGKKLGEICNKLFALP
jgi:hypothetical protein